MELSWVNKLRITAVAALGIVVIGILAWPLALPQDPLMPVRAPHLGFSETLVLLVLAFGIGFTGYFIAWPHGREDYPKIAMVAVCIANILLWARGDASIIFRPFVYYAVFPYIAFLMIRVKLSTMARI